MIARIWHGTVPTSKSARYLELMRSVAIPDYRKVPGNRNAFVLHRVDGEIAHFVMLSFWESDDAIRRFAGEDYELAQYYEFDAQYLIEKEARVKHYSIYDN